MIRLRSLPLIALLALASAGVQAAETGSTSTPPEASSTTALSAPATSPAALPPGEGLPTAPQATATLEINREIVLDLSDRRISLLENGQAVNSWPVAIGDPGTPTPTGRFSVRNKVVNPQYQSTKSGKVNPAIGPNSPLGERWLGFSESGPNQYGIHGTPSAWSWTVTSRAAVTNGCVRMLADHVRQLFDRVDVGTPVVVRP